MTEDERPEDGRFWLGVLGAVLAVYLCVGLLVSLAAAVLAP
jgi:hypothetical protein